MKRTRTALVILSLVSVVMSANAFAQMGMHWRGGGEWGMGSQYGRMYDPKTIETISSVVERSI